MILRTTKPLLMYTIRPEDLWWQAKKPVLHIISTLSAGSPLVLLRLGFLSAFLTSLGITFLESPPSLDSFFYPPLSYFRDGLDIHFLWDHYRPFQDSFSISSLDLKSWSQTPLGTCQFELQLFKDIPYKMPPPPVCLVHNRMPNSNMLEEWKRFGEQQDEHHHCAGLTSNFPLLPLILFI